MDPLFDEKFVHLLNRNIPVFLEETIGIHAVREAYGPSRNEGLCYESVVEVPFQGDVEGSLYVCMEGYTRLKLLPAMAHRGRKKTGELLNADELVEEFISELTISALGDLEDAGIELRFGSPINLSHKLVPVDLALFRQYHLILFLKNQESRQYSGRLYLILILRKFGTKKEAPSG